MVILQEKLLKRMGSLWKVTQEMQDNLNEETTKTQILEVRMKMFYLFLCRLTQCWLRLLAKFNLAGKG